MKKLITRNELIRMLGVSKTTLWRWEKRGYFTPIRVPHSKKVFYEYSELEKFIELGKKSKK